MRVRCLVLAVCVQPTGRVVGIIKRNWRNRGYCGSLQPSKLAGRAGQRQGMLVALVERNFPLVRWVGGRLGWVPSAPLWASDSVCVCVSVSLSARSSVSLCATVHVCLSLCVCACVRGRAGEGR